MSVTINEELTVRGMDDEGYGSITVDLDTFANSEYQIPSELPDVDTEISGTDVFRYTGAMTLHEGQTFAIKGKETFSVETGSEVFVIQKRFEDNKQTHLVAENTSQTLLALINERSRSNRFTIISETHPAYENVRAYLFERYSTQIPDLVVEHIEREFPALTSTTEGIYIGSEPKVYLILDRWFYNNIENFESELVTNFI